MTEPTETELKGLERATLADVLAVVEDGLGGDLPAPAHLSIQTVGTHDVMVRIDPGGGGESDGFALTLPDS